MQELRAVSESVPGEVIVLHFQHQFWLQRLPLGRALGAPTARPAGRVARKAGRLDQRFDFLQQRFSFGLRKAGGEADVMKQAIIVKAQQK